MASCTILSLFTFLVSLSYLYLPSSCSVDYDNTTFLGLEDKTVLLKKCGPSIVYDTDGMSRRDSVLAALVGSSGPYRVGGSVDVQGLAQCVGDLSLAECEDCISEAIGRVKRECGGAVYGDMFLAKCYARYSTGGSDVYTKVHHHGKLDWNLYGHVIL